MIVRKVPLPKVGVRLRASACSVNNRKIVGSMKLLGSLLDGSKKTSAEAMKSLLRSANELILEYKRRVGVLRLLRLLVEGEHPDVGFDYLSVEVNRFAIGGHFWELDCCIRQNLLHLA